ncbi:hypothetical protein WG947_05210 [Pontibacter sp. H259]|uniref:hypothetical protein n=1 Tax=Pontibacter sp. H259 TaxID=3133421 RepID=UPI0030BBFC2B
MGENIETVIKGLALYLDPAEYSQYISGKHSLIVEKAEALEEPYRKAGEVQGISSTYLPIPETSKEAFQFLKEVRAKQAFEMQKVAFVSKYGGWDVEQIIKAEIENIECFIALARTTSISSAFEVRPYRPVNVNSRVMYQCVDTSITAELLRLEHGFYNQYYFEGNMYSLPAMVYALCEYFLPYLKGKLSNRKSGLAADDSPIETKGLGLNVKSESILIDEVILPFISIIKDFFSKNEQHKLTRLLDSNESPPQKLLFKGDGNKLADAFKQLYNAHLVVGITKKELEAWIAKHFVYLHRGKTTEFTPRYLNDIISTTKDKCQKPILNIRLDKDSGRYKLTKA